MASTQQIVRSENLVRAQKLLQILSVLVMILCNFVRDESLVKENERQVVGRVGLVADVVRKRVAPRDFGGRERDDAFALRRRFVNRSSSLDSREEVKRFLGRVVRADDGSFELLEEGGTAGAGENGARVEDRSSPLHFIHAVDHHVTDARRLEIVPPKQLPNRIFPDRHVVAARAKHLLHPF